MYISLSLTNDNYAGWPFGRYLLAEPRNYYHDGFYRFSLPRDSAGAYLLETWNYNTSSEQDGSLSLLLAGWLEDNAEQLLWFFPEKDRNGAEQALQSCITFLVNRSNGLDGMGLENQRKRAGRD